MVTITVGKAKFMKSDYSIFISFPYDEVKLNFIRKFKERAWLKNDKVWEAPIDRLKDFLDRFPDDDIVIKGEYVDLQPDEEIDSADWFDFTTEPFEYQVDGFLYGMNHKKWLLGDQMGLGKSKQAIDIAVGRKENDGYQHCMIICGVNSLKENWKNEVEKHSNETARILGTRRRKNGAVYVGSNNDKYDDLVDFYNGEFDDYFIITNVESFRNKDILELTIDLIDDHILNMIVIDEAHKAIKDNPNKSQQGKAIMKLQPEYRLPMTGTPIMNHPLDAYGILAWLGLEKHSYYSFSHYYAEYGGYGGYEIVGYKHLDELEADLNSIMLRRLKDDVLDLPEKLYVDEVVEMYKKQKSIYDEVKAEIKMNIDKLEISPNPLAEMIRMRQATGYPGILSSEVEDSAKLDRMMELVRDIVENGEKVIIFSNWTQITDAAYMMLRDEFDGIVITGNTNDAERQKYVDLFQTDDEIVFALGTTGAMGTGLTMTAANNVIFLDEPWSEALKEQALDRVHRISQRNNVTIYTIMCKDTIDQKIHDLVYKKGAMSDLIVDGQVVDMHKRELIDYLLD